MTNLPVLHYLIFSVIIFSLSLTGIIINHKNLLTLLMSIELMYIAINTNLIAFSNLLQENTGNTFVFFILTVAAAETAIGLAIVIVLFRTHKTINASKLNIYKD